MRAASAGAGIVVVDARRLCAMRVGESELRVPACFTATQLPDCQPARSESGPQEFVWLPFVSMIRELRDLSPCISAMKQPPRRSVA
jgi:hypothetical protein